MAVRAVVALALLAVGAEGSWIERRSGRVLMGRHGDPDPVTAAIRRDAQLQSSPYQEQAGNAPWSPTETLPYVPSVPEQGNWHVYNEEFYYCHHEAACGTRALPGLQQSVQDPGQLNDGIQCYCRGFDRANGGYNTNCYHGTCDAGVQRRTLRGRAQDNVRELKIEGVLDTVAYSEMHGLCKFQQLLDTQVDQRLCAHLVPKYGKMYDIVTPSPARNLDYIKVAEEFEKKTKNSKYKSDPGKYNDDVVLPMGPQEWANSLLMSSLHTVKARQKKAQDTAP